MEIFFGNIEMAGRADCFIPAELGGLDGVHILDPALAIGEIKDSHGVAQLAVQTDRTAAADHLIIGMGRDDKDFVALRLIHHGQTGKN